jgi:hypothetical protein
MTTNKLLQKLALTSSMETAMINVLTGTEKRTWVLESKKDNFSWVLRNGRK